MNVTLQPEVQCEDCSAVKSYYQFSAFSKNGMTWILIRKKLYKIQSDPYQLAGSSSTFLIFRLTSYNFNNF
jgi:hypothetical protein